MLDCHSHILPGLDDGAPDITTSIGICRMMHDGGITTVVATPHWRSPRFTTVEPDAISSTWDRAANEIMAAVPGLTLVLGAEHHLSGLQRADDFVASVRTLGASKRVLVELPDDHLPSNAVETLFLLIRRGYRPIIAHPERCKGFPKLEPHIEGLLDAGLLLQLTLGCLLGHHGWMMRFRARRLLSRHGQRCIIASDSHDLKARRPRWGELPDRWRPHIPRDLADLDLR